MTSVLCEKQEAAANANEKQVDTADKKHDKRGIYEEGYGGGDFGGHGDFGGGYGGGHGDFGGGYGGHDFGGHDDHHHHDHHVHHEKTIVNVKKVKQ